MAFATCNQRTAEKIFCTCVFVTSGSVFHNTHTDWTCLWSWTYSFLWLLNCKSFRRWNLWGCHAPEAPNSPQNTRRSHLGRSKVGERLYWILQSITQFGNTACFTFIRHDTVDSTQSFLIIIICIDTSSILTIAMYNDVCHDVSVIWILYVHKHTCKLGWKLF